MSPVVVALHVSPGNHAPPLPRDRIELLEDRGVEGDHHARPGSQRQVLLMSAETLEALDLRPGAVHEQVTVRGIDVMTLREGVRFGIGSAEFEVGGPCAPCDQMEKIRPGLRDQLEGRRGRFARVVRPGSITIGDALEVRAES